MVSYSNEFAAELHRQFRMLVDAPWYQKLFPAMRAAKDNGTELVTTQGGSRYATSVGGTVNSGRGARTCKASTGYSGPRALGTVAAALDRSRRTCSARS